MTDAIWYYAQGDKEQGPVTFAQIKTLIQAGKIKPDDLVWKDGMDDWLPAQSVPGLIGGAEVAIPDAPAAYVPPATREKAPASTAAPKIAASPRPAEPAAPPPAAVPAAPPAELPAATTAVVSAPRAAAPAASASSASVPSQLGRNIAWGLVVFGFFVMLSSRGCDAVGQRYAARARAVAEAASPSTPEIVQGARLAEADYRLWSMLRESLFVFGVFVLAGGLFTNGLRGEGTEKWICLALLGVIVFGLIVGGAGLGAIGR